MNQTEEKKWSFQGDGLLIFPEPYQVIKAYELLQAEGIDGKIITPDPKLRLGCCALALEISLEQTQKIEELFTGINMDYHRIIPK